MRKKLTGRHLMPVDSIIVIEKLHFSGRHTRAVLVFPIVEKFGKHSVWTKLIFFTKDPKGG